MLKKIPFLAEACEIVYSHQEHFDGTGYPRDLKGARNSARRPHFLRRRYSGCNHLRPPLSPGQNSSPKLAKKSRPGTAASLIPRLSSLSEDARQYLRRPPPRNQRPDLSLQLLRQRQRQLTFQKKLFCHPERSGWCAKRTSRGVEGSLARQRNCWPRKAFRECLVRLL